MGTSTDRRESTRATRAAGLTALILAAVVMAFPSIAGAASSEPGDDGNIVITQVDSAIQGNCLPSALVLTYLTRNTPEYYELTIRASAPPCDPIDAKAVIYSMPGKGVAWPQKLAEVKEFTISRAGRTTVHFTKTCDPVQFDVLTGATPGEISPWGEWHGPLLFPLDVDTSLQYWGQSCGTTTTTSTTSTTAPTTTTTTPANTTTSTNPPSTETTAPEVLPTTTVRPEVPTTVEGINEERDPNEPGVQVADTTQERDKGDKLAYTGGNARGPVVVGALLALAGAVMLVVSRRRNAHA